VNLLSDRGHYPIDSTWGYGKRLFDKEKRVAQFEHKAKNNYSKFLIYADPGPGSYRSPSDFGHYDGDVYKNSGAIAYMGRSTKLTSFNNSIRSSKSRL